MENGGVRRRLGARREGKRTRVRLQKAYQAVQLAWQGFPFVQGARADKMSACLQRDAAIAPRGLVNVESRIVLTNGGMPSETAGESRSERDIVTNRREPGATFDSGWTQRLTVKPFELEEVPPYVARLRGQLGPRRKG